MPRNSNEQARNYVSDRKTIRPPRRLWSTAFATLDPRNYTNPYHYDRDSSTHSTERIAPSRRNSGENGSGSRKKYTNTVIIVVLLIIMAFVIAVTVALLVSGERGEITPVDYTAVMELNRTWQPSLADPTSLGYANFVRDFIRMIDAAYGGSDLSDQYISTLVTNLREGSVIVVFNLKLSTILENGLQTAISPPVVLDTLSAAILQDRSSNSDTQPLAVLVVMSSLQLAELSDCSIDDCFNGNCIEDANGIYCNCSVGFYGVTCQDNIDDCSPNPCVHGLCQDQVNAFFCNCSAGFNGTLCEIDIDECTSNPCVNGECVDQVNGVSCDCSAGYTGEICETDINECSSDPCVHGSCNDQVNGFSCNCLAGYNGATCDNDIDECYSDPCVYGSCIDQVNGFYCNCSAGFNGTICDNDIDECSSDPCVNGECIDKINGFSCNCSAGYDGMTCDNDINECASDPCVNGLCKDQVNGFRCKCFAGYNGTTCDNDIDDCSSNPCMFGSCIDEVNDFFCNCSAGYNGTICDIDIDECSSNPCVNGNCTDEVNGFFCNCSAGFNGKTCEIDIDECSSNPCVNGTCIDQVNGFFCNCSDGFNGTICDIDIDDCSSDPCVNGTCIDLVNDFYCNCTAGFNGTICDNDIDECSSDPCVNSSCIDQVNDFYCNCSAGYEGKTCDKEIDECATGPCAYGVCIDQFNGFTCNCSIGFNGTLCDNNIDDCIGVECNNGECVDQANGFLCNCSLKYGGRFCDEIVRRDCTFEGGQECFLHQSPIDNLDWQNVTGETPTADTGPSAAIEGDRYALISTAESEKEDFAILLSDPFPAGEYCLSFYYSMYGVSMGGLEVSLTEFSASSLIIFNKKGDQGDGWKYERTAINSSFEFQVVFKGIRGGTPSDIALDYIVLLNGDCGCSSNPCLHGGTCESTEGNGYQCTCLSGFSGTRCENVPANATLSCTFEDGTNCFLTQSLSDQNDWIIREGATSNSLSGPPNAGEGQKYSHIENVGIILEDDTAVYTSLPSSFEDGDWCISFMYHMEGDDINKLEVLNNGQVIFSRTGSQGSLWITTDLNVHLNQTAEIQIIGYAGNGAQADIAIDDILLKPGACFSDGLKL